MRQNHDVLLRSRFFTAAIIIAGILFALLVKREPHLLPANTNASPVARAVLTFLSDLPNQSENRVISGQLAAYNDSLEHGEARLADVMRLGGSQVALTGIDYSQWDMSGLHDFTVPNQFLLRFWCSGGLVTVSWHARNPWTGGQATDTRNGPRGLAELLDQDTEAHQRWLIQLYKVADGLQELQAAGVVVIWRPFHEMNGTWFWWGNADDPEDFRGLWKHMFAYLTHERQLDNLLWAYSPNDVTNGSSNMMLSYYPGDEYVDLVGLDKYADLADAPLVLRGYDELVEVGKPLGIMEFGPVSAEESDPVRKYDYETLIRDIQNKYPRVSYFMAWEWIWSIPYHRNAAGLMNHPWTISRDELPLWTDDSRAYAGCQ